MFTIEKRTAADGEWKSIYQDASEAKTRRQFLKYKTILAPKQAIRLTHQNEVIDEVLAPQTRLTSIEE